MRWDGEGGGGAWPKSFTEDVGDVDNGVKLLSQKVVNEQNINDVAGRK